MDCPIKSGNDKLLESSTSSFPQLAACPEDTRTEEENRERRAPNLQPKFVAVTFNGTEPCLILILRFAEVLFVDIVEEPMIISVSDPES